MNIAMIGHKRVPGREGGVEVVVEELTGQLTAMGHTVTLYNRAAKGTPKCSEYAGARIVTVPTVNKKSLDAVIYSFLATLHALFGGYDVIHYHALGPSVMLALPHFLGKRTVATVHGLDWQRAKWGGFGTWYLKLGEKVIARYADEVIVLSENVQRYFRETYGRETTLIPNGVAEPTRRPAGIIREKYGLEPNGYVLFLARIVPEKGLHYLLEAFRSLHTGKKLVIAGGDSHSGGYYEEMCQKADEDARTVRTGFVRGPVCAAQRPGGDAHQPAGGHELRHPLPGERHPRKHPAVGEVWGQLCPRRPGCPGRGPEPGFAGPAPGGRGPGGVHPAELFLGEERPGYAGAVSAGSGPAALSRLCPSTKQKGSLPHGIHCKGPAQGHSLLLVRPGRKIPAHSAVHCHLAGKNARVGNSGVE